MHSRNVIILFYFRKYFEWHSFDWQIMINASKILHPRTRNEFRCHQIVCSAFVVQRSFDLWKLCEKPSWFCQNNLLFKSIFIFIRFKWSVNSDLWSIKNPYIFIQLHRLTHMCAQDMEFSLFGIQKYAFIIRIPLGKPINPNVRKRIYYSNCFEIKCFQIKWEILNAWSISSQIT